MTDLDATFTTVGKRTCPSCGHPLNDRYVNLSAPLVAALYAVYRHCLATGRHEFRRKELDEVITRSGWATAYANFGYWKWFSEGTVYTPEGKGRGWWGFNTERLQAFFNGERRVATRLLVSGSKTGSHILQRLEPARWDEVKGVADLLDEDGRFVIEYVG